MKRYNLITLFLAGANFWDCLMTILFKTPTWITGVVLTLSLAYLAACLLYPTDSTEKKEASND